jgi:predicted O-methyltransferase YrrM
MSSTLFQLDKIKDRNALADLFAARGYTVGAEVGTFKGGYASVLLERVPLRRLYCVDLWNGAGMSAEYDGQAIFEECKRNLARFGNRAEMLRSDSAEGATGWQMRNLDFVYIDADHRYEPCKKDIIAWLPCVRSGGMIAGHDYSRRGGKGVIQAVKEVFGDRHYVTLEHCPSWFVFKV